MIKTISFLLWSAVILLLNSCVTQSKSKPTANVGLPSAGVSTNATTAQVSPAGGLSNGRSGPKSFASFFDPKKLRTQKGLMTVHWQDDKYYFEIPNQLLGKDLLAVSRFVRTTVGAGVYGGEETNENVLRFETGPDNRIFLRTVLNVVSSPDSSKPIYTAVRNAGVEPIAAAFDIKAYNRDSTGLVIDVTDFFKGDNQIVSLSPIIKRSLGLLNLASDRSYIENIKSYGDNTEIRTVKTFNAAASASVSPAAPPVYLPAANVAGAVTLELNTSIIRLPELPMKRRFFDPRVGYFADENIEFFDTAQRVTRDAFIVRWRLEPKPEDVSRYKRGELVEPLKPLVYYIDPSTPTNWKPYLIQGINDWNIAFEKAGFKNAIVGKEWPGDSTMSLEGANYSAIRYLASDIANAYGPRIHDPRTGEILESHIGWYHNVMKVLHSWYFIQAGAVDPAARKMKFDDALMGDLIRFVSSHEVGHTLGLRHNMGTSSFTPVEKLRDKAWVEKHGHTSSIMDYARFNYVAQPEDSISRKGIYPRIGEYDLWAIEWGYRWTDKSEQEDRREGNELIVKRLAQNPRLWFGGEGRGNDPRSQTEDLGDNSMKASEYGILNLKRIVKNLSVWSREEGDLYDNLNEMYGQVVGQYSRYANHVIRNIGGVEENYKSVEQEGNVYAPTSKAKQKEAVTWLNKFVFETPQWLLEPNVLNKISEPLTNTAGNAQASALGNVLSASRLGRMLEVSERFGKESYSVLELLQDLKQGIWKELQVPGKPGNLYRRNLQKIYVDRLSEILTATSVAATGATVSGNTNAARQNFKNTDLPSIARGHMAELQISIRDALKRSHDKVGQFHLMDLDQRIEQALHPGK